MEKGRGDRPEGQCPILPGVCLILLEFQGRSLRGVGKGVRSSHQAVPFRLGGQLFQKELNVICGGAS
jgi:hypothetical protein